MSGPDAADAGQYRVPAGLLEKLMAAVRPEFRADEMTFDPRDPVFGGKPCLVSGCERPACGHGLCHGHRQRWAAAGRPGVREFTEPAASPWRKNAPLSRCQAPECRYGVGRRKGLCVRHSDAWERAGTPALADWLDTLPGAAPAAPLADCLIGSCGLWAEPGSDWCRSHGATWKRHGRPPAGEFAAQWSEDEPGAGRERIWLEALPAQLKLEVQYALQRRCDERAGKAPPYVVMIMVRFLAGSGAFSLLDRAEQEWREAFGRKRSNAVALLAWSRRQLADLAESGGWDAEYPRDAWRMHRLGFEGRNVLDFSGIPQQELKELAKRWIRWRLSTGLGPEAGGRRPLRFLTRLSVFLHGRGIGGADGITRAAIEDYLADLHAAMAGRPEHGAHVSAIGLFLTAVRQHGWGPGLPADAMLFPGDQPPRIELLPRALAGHVMAQVEQPGNLTLQDNPAYRLATLILDPLRPAGLRRAQAALRLRRHRRCRSPLPALPQQQDETRGARPRR